MLLRDFSDQFGALGDEFLFHFKRPFLVEEGRLSFDDDDEDDERHVFYLKGPEARLVVGRSSRVEVTIPSHNVSSRHLELIAAQTPGAPWHIRDLGSTNGTFLNGQPLPKGDLRPLGDEAVIGLGPITSYLFLEPQTFLQYLRRQAQRSGKLSAPVSLQEETCAGMPAVALPDVSGSSDPAPARLRLVCEPFDPIPFEVGQRVVVGRSSIHAQLVLPHPQISRRHTEFERREEGVFVRDLHSANGTFVGETRVGGQFVQLLPGKAVKAGDFVIQVVGYPVDSEQFGSTIAVPAGAHKALKGSLDKLSLENLLLSLEEQQKTGVVDVFASEASGRISFRAGSPCEAWADGGLEGREAVCFLLRHARTGTFRLDTSPEQVGERKIALAFSELALETFLSE